MFVCWIGCAESAAPVGTSSGEPTGAGETTSSADAGEGGASSSGTSSSSDGGSSSEGSSGPGGGSSEAGASSEYAGLCGDGQLDPGEECDNGLSNDEDAACLLDCLKARCGDGRVFPLLEECDDGNEVALDECDECGRTRRVFVTSEVYQGAVFAGLEGADQRCRSLAAQAGLPGFATYKAWLSDSRTAPALRMYRGRGRYELVNGLVVALDWESLLANGPLVPIVVTQTSETHETPVWTGTNPDGTAAEGSDHCADWTSQNANNTGFAGMNTETSADWTRVDDALNPIDCGAPSAIYCFEQE